MVFAALLVAGCAPGPSSWSTSYVDFVQHGEIQYVAARTELGRGLADADLGPEQFRIGQTLARTGRGPGYLPADGDAAFIPSGDPVFAVRVYVPTFRLAARHDGRLVLYEADSNPAAKRGSDLLDIDGIVMGIALLSPKDGRTVLGRITDPARLRDLVALVLAASVDQGRALGAPSPPPAFVAFELRDGSVSARAYSADAGILSRGILVAGAFRDAIAQLQAAAPTPTPRPASINLTARYDLARAATVRLKGPPGSVRADAPNVADLARALDRDIATVAPGPARESIFIVLEFVDHFVSLAYDSTSDLLTVYVPDPDDRLTVATPPAFRSLVLSAR